MSGITYDFNRNNGTLTIAGSGRMKELCPETESAGAERSYPWRAYKNEIRRVVIDSGVVDISRDAFRACENLEEVVVADGVQAIGMNAFRGCSALTSVQLPESVRLLGRNAFCDCSNLIAAELPGSMLRMGPNVFNRCEDLTYIMFTGSEERWEKLRGDDLNEELDQVSVYCAA